VWRRAGRCVPVVRPSRLVAVGDVLGQVLGGVADAACRVARSGQDALSVEVRHVVAEEAAQVLDEPVEQRFVDR
jgi:hypothetical protein